jgi:tRNA pseudouridine32 synthase/23S rRNA pseudouridine746 synthase
MQDPAWWLFRFLQNKLLNGYTIQDGYDLQLPHLRNFLEPEYGRCWIVHRLDKETSGAIVVARTKDSHRALSLLFEKREITKSYRAIVEGVLAENKIEIDLPLRINGDRKHRTVIDQVDGKPASTSIEFISNYEDYSLVSAFPHTGYTHQIRTHLAYIKHPILGDSLYNPHPKENTFYQIINGLALHSYSLEFVHPFTNNNLIVTAPFSESLLPLINLFK